MSIYQMDLVEDALKDIADGKLVIVADDADRENEGDLIMAANKASTEKVAFMIRHTSGILCVPMEKNRAEELRLAPMVHDNNAPLSTAFTISVDYRQGLTTGISAEERSNTVLALSNNNMGAADFVRPGHLFPLISRDGGVLVRSGHTEAAVDLARLASCGSVGLLAEIVNDNGTVMRLNQLFEFKKEHNLKMISIADLIAYRQRREKLVERVQETTIQTSVGTVKALVYKTNLDACQHLALIFGDLAENQPVLTRIHRERIIDDIFGSQLGHADSLVNAGLAAIARKGQGVFLYLRQSDQATVEDTRSAEQRQAQWKEIGVGAQILKDLGINSISLLSGRTHHYIGLSGFGIEIASTELLNQG